MMRRARKNHTDRSETSGRDESSEVEVESPCENAGPGSVCLSHESHYASSEDDRGTEHRPDGRQAIRPPVRTVIAKHMRHGGVRTRQLRPRVPKRVHFGDDDQDEEESSNTSSGKTPSLPYGFPSPPSSHASGDEAYAALANFEEWPLQDAVLKRVMVDEVWTFRLQFAWNQSEGYAKRPRAGQFYLPSRDPRYRRQ
ncbi:hypothetical protein F5B21DRAFT_518058 [Xylaria acuta]|nr:hypothetical protein F5B21DRAFT_518058 [Xylaria acuta]